MICEKCGAAAAEGVTTCPECGEPIGAVTAPATVPGSAAVATPASSRPAWLIPVIAVVVLAVIAVGAFLLWPKSGASASGPEGAVTRMMEAFATYDAQGILDNATHASMTATDIAAFTKQASDAKKTASGKPGLKDLKIVSSTPDPKDKNTVVVKVAAQWLTDQAKGTYTQRTETLTVVFKGGKWQVQLFQ